MAPFGSLVLVLTAASRARALQHDVRVMFSLDVLAIVPFTGSKATMFKVGERRVGGR